MLLANRKWIVYGAMIAIASGCTIAKISGRGVIPLMLNNPTQKVKVIGPLSEKKMITFDYTNSFDVSEVIAQKLRTSDANAVTNLVITIKVDVPSYLFNVCTLGLAQAKIFQVEGELVKFEGGTGMILENSEIITKFNGSEKLKLPTDLTGEGVTLIRFDDDGFALIRPRSLKN